MSRAACLICRLSAVQIVVCCHALFFVPSLLLVLYVGLVVMVFRAASAYRRESIRDRPCCLRMHLPSVSMFCITVQGFNAADDTEFQAVVMAVDQVSFLVVRCAGALFLPVPSCHHRLAHVQAGWPVACVTTQSVPNILASLIGFCGLHFRECGQCPVCSFSLMTTCCVLRTYRPSFVRNAAQQLLRGTSRRP